MDRLLASSLRHRHRAILNCTEFSEIRNACSCRVCVNNAIFMTKSQCFIWMCVCVCVRASTLINLHIGKLMYINSLYQNMKLIVSNNHLLARCAHFNCLAESKRRSSTIACIFAILFNVKDSTLTTHLCLHPYECVVNCHSMLFNIVDFDIIHCADV